MTGTTRTYYLHHCDDVIATVESKYELSAPVVRQAALARHNASEQTLSDASAVARLRLQHATVFCDER